MSGKTDVLGKIYMFINFGWAKARRQAPPLPHGSYATVAGFNDSRLFINCSLL